MDWLYSPWNSPSQNTGVGSLSSLQGIFPTQGSNPGLPHCRRILFQLSHKGMCSFIQQIFRQHLPLLGEIFPSQESNASHLLCRQILYCLSHQESPESTYYVPDVCRMPTAEDNTLAITERDTKMIKSQNPLLLRRSLGRGGWGKGREVSKERNTHTTQYKGDYNVGNYSCKAHLFANEETQMAQRG